MGSLAKFFTDLSVVASEAYAKEDFAMLEGVCKALEEAGKAVAQGKRWSKVADYELEDVRYEVSKAAKQIINERYYAEVEDIPGDEQDEDEEDSVEDYATDEETEGVEDDEEDNGNDEDLEDAGSDPNEL